MKRLFDILASLLLLILLSPILLVLAVLVRIKLGSPIFFRQGRAGLHGNEFRMIKFRSMTDGRDADGNLLPDDQRLPRFGQILRSTSADELPELLNVLKGDMSLVGPRPLLTRYLERYTPEQNRRHEVRPGITGWAQVNGRNNLPWEDRFALDVWYVDNRTMALDLKILWMTFLKVVKRSDVSQEGHATMAEFTGSRARMIEGVLLTGGASRRMGTDKASLDLGGETLGERSARVLLEVCSKVTVLGPEPVLGLPNRPDREPHAGPLAALAAFEPTGELIAVLACDMPLVTADLFRNMAKLIGDADAAVPVTDGRLHPTCAVYRRAAFSVATEVLAEGRKSMMAWLDRLQIATLEVDPRLVANLNEPGDLDLFKT